MTNIEDIDLNQKIDRGIHYSILVINMLFSIFLIFWTVIWILYAPVNRDAGYYLPLAERITEGFIPYAEIQMGYPPLVVFIFSLLNTFLSNTDYRAYVALVILVNIFNSILFYFLSAVVLRNKPIRYFSSLVFFFFLYKLQGFMIVLEPFLIFFVLLSLIVYIKANVENKALFYFLTGFFVSLAFLSKQFGIVMFVPFIVDIILKRIKTILKLRQIVWILVGGVTPIAILFLFLNLFNQVTLNDIFHYEYVKSYGYRSILITTKSIYRFIFKRQFAFLVVFLPLLLFNKKVIKDRVFIFIIISMCCFMTPLYFKQYFHYYILPYPFYLGFCLYLINYIKGNKQIWIVPRRIVYMMIVVLFLFSPLFHACSLISKNEIENMKNKKNLQLYIGIEINKYIPTRSKVLNLGAPEYNFLSKFYPPNNKIGYSFTYKCNLEEIEQFSSEVNYVLFSPKFKLIKHSPIGTEIITDSKAIVNVLKKHGHRRVKRINESIEVWMR